MNEILLLGDNEMNEIVNKLLLVGDKLIPEMHLKHPVSLNKSEFTYSACGRFTTKKKELKNSKKTKTKNGRYKLYL